MGAAAAAAAASPGVLTGGGLHSSSPRGGRREGDRCWPVLVPALFQAAMTRAAGTEYMTHRGGCGVVVVRQFDVSPGNVVTCSKRRFWLRTDRITVRVYAAWWIRWAEILFCFYGDLFAKRRRRRRRRRRRVGEGGREAEGWISKQQTDRSLRSAPTDNSASQSSRAPTLASDAIDTPPLPCHTPSTLPAVHTHTHTHTHTHSQPGHSQ